MKLLILILALSVAACKQSEMGIEKAPEKTEFVAAATEPAKEELVEETIEEVEAVEARAEYEAHFYDLQLEVLAHLGEIQVGSIVTKQIEVINPNNFSVELESSLEDSFMLLAGDNMSYTGGVYPGVNGTCSHIIPANGCVVELMAAPKTVGTVIGFLEFKQKNVNNVQKFDFHYIGLDRSSDICTVKQAQLVWPSATPSSDVLLPYQGQFQNGLGQDKTVDTITEKTQRPTDYSNDVQILTSFDTESTDRLVGEAIGSENSSIQMYVDFVKTELNSNDTEIICIDTEFYRGCNGKSWASAKSEDFFGSNIEGVQPATESTVPWAYTEAIEEARATNPGQSELYYTGIAPLSDMLGYPRGGIVDKNLNVIIADDTFVQRELRLEVLREYEISCN